MKNDLLWSQNLNSLSNRFANAAKLADAKNNSIVSTNLSMGSITDSNRQSTKSLTRKQQVAVLIPPSKQPNNPSRATGKPYQASNAAQLSQNTRYNFNRAQLIYGGPAHDQYHSVSLKKK